MWTYEIKTGRLYDDSGELEGVGYSGTPQYKNDPSATELEDKGPLPVGVYQITSPVDTRTHGPYVLWLDPDPSNEMYGRSAFGIHGDSVITPGTASEGCIVLPKGVREKIWSSGDHDLTVIAMRSGEGLGSEGNPPS